MTAAKRPSSQLSHTPVWGFSLGTLGVFIAASQWIGLAVDDHNRVWRIILGVVATLAAISCLTSAAVQLRRKRRDTV